MRQIAPLATTFGRQGAYIKIRNWILDGTLAPGDQVRDKE